MQSSLAEIDKEYSDETLSSAVQSDDSGRHVLRMCQVALSRCERLKEQDVLDVERLIGRIFGSYSLESTLFFKEDPGWMQKVHVGARTGGRFDLLRKNPVKTFDKQAFSREQLIAFRLCDIMDPKQTGNLFSWVFRSDRAKAKIPLSLDWCFLPYYVQRSIAKSLEMKEPRISFPFQFYNELSFASDTQLYVGANMQGTSMPVDVEELFILRFLAWFVFDRHDKIYRLGHKQETKQAPVADGLLQQQNKTPARVGKPEMFFSVRNVNAYSQKEPSIEILREFLIELFKFNVQGTQVSRQAYLLFMGALHFWFWRNTPPQGASAQPFTQPLPYNVQASSFMNGGAMSFRQAPFSKSTEEGEFIKPSPMLMRALVTFITFFQTDPSLRFDLRSFNRGSQLNDVMRGSSVFMHELRKAFFDFARVTLKRMPNNPDKSEQDYISVLSVVDLWLSYVQPWRAEVKWQMPKRTKSATGPLAASLKNVLPHRPNAGSAPSPAPSTTSEVLSQQSQQQAVVRDFYNEEWTWFVIQNYLVYAHILKLSLKELERSELNVLDFEVLFRIFSSEGPFCDAILVVLRACEIIIEDEVLRQQRELFPEVLATFPWLGEKLGIRRNSESPSPTRKPSQSLSPGKKATQGGRIDESELIRQQLFEMDRDRRVIYAVLKMQMDEVGWRVEQDAVPAIMDCKDLAGRIVVQADRFAKRLARQEQQKGYAAEIGRTMDWLGKTLSSTVGKPTQEDEQASRLKSAQDCVERMNRIFDIQTVEEQSQFQFGPGVHLEKESQGGAPASELMFGSPSWFKYQVYCVYRRLTAQGRVQLASGARQCRNDKMKYVGDPLVNPPPVCSYEIGFLVRSTFVLSTWLNGVLGLEGAVYDLDGEVEQMEKQFRVNLRFLADARNLLFGFLVFLVLNAVFLHLPVYLYTLTLMAVLVLFLSTSEIAFWASSFTVVAIAGLVDALLRALQN